MEPNPSSCTKVLVDTSLLIEQMKKEEEARPVRNALSMFRFRGVSSFSKLEAKGAWAQQLVYLCDLCADRHVRNLADIYQHLSRLPKLQHAKLTTCLQAMARFLGGATRAPSAKVLLMRFRAQLKRAALAFGEELELLATDELQGTGCIRAQEPIRESGNGKLDASIPRCTRNHPQCGIAKFIEKHTAELTRLVSLIDDIENPSKQLAATRELVKAALKDPHHIQDRQNCRRMGDVIIALDGLGMDLYAANNDQDWRPIAMWLGKELMNPVSGTGWPPSSSLATTADAQKSHA